MIFEFKNITFNFMPDPNHAEKLLPSVYIPNYLPTIDNSKENFDKCLEMYLKKCKVTITLEVM